MDDASPSVGNMYDPYDESSAAGGQSLPRDEGNLLSDRQMKSREVRQRPNPRESPTDSTANTFSIDKVTRQPRSFDDDFGDVTVPDASPERSPAAGGAWARIRQQAARPTSGSSSARGGSPGVRGNRRDGRQPDEQSGGDSFAFSATEEERQLAREEVQRAFDERVERERRGGDFLTRHLSLTQRRMNLVSSVAVPVGVV